MDTKGHNVNFQLQNTALGFVAHPKWGHASRLGLVAFLGAGLAQPSPFPVGGSGAGSESVALPGFVVLIPCLASDLWAWSLHTRL